MHKTTPLSEASWDEPREVDDESSESHCCWCEQRGTILSFDDSALQNQSQQPTTLCSKKNMWPHFWW